MSDDTIHSVVFDHEALGAEDVVLHVLSEMITKTAISLSLGRGSTTVEARDINEAAKILVPLLRQGE